MDPICNKNLKTDWSNNDNWKDKLSCTAKNPVVQDVLLKNTTRFAHTIPLATALGIPQASAFGGFGLQIFKNQNQILGAATDIALFALSLHPEYGFVVDLLYFGIEMYKTKSFTTEAALYLGSAFLGTTNSYVHYTRFVNRSEKAIKQANVSIPMWRLVHDVVSLRQKEKAAGTLISMVDDTKVCVIIENTMRDIGYTDAELGIKFVEKIKRQTLERIQQGMPPERSRTFFNLAVMQQISRTASPWLSLGPWAFSPRGFHKAVEAMTSEQRVSNFLWQKTFDFSKILRAANLASSSPSMSRLAMVRSWYKKERIFRDFPRCLVEDTTLCKSGEQFIVKLSKELAQKFPNAFRYDANGQEVKNIRTLLENYEDGEVPYDFVRARLITSSDGTVTANERTAEITKYLIRQYNAIPTFTLGRTARLGPHKAYRATHLIIPHETGFIELQIMGENMRYWTPYDHDLYKMLKSGQAVPEANLIRNYEDGVEAFARDGGYRDVA